jgi:hypothetical protein
MSMEGKKNWYIIDGYLPYKDEIKNGHFEGHEAIMILNCHEVNANVKMDIFFDDMDPVEAIEIIVQAKRVKCIRMDHPDEIGGTVIDRQKQYSLRFRSDIEVIVQYGRMDIAQPNLAYIGLIGYSE